MSAKAEPFVSLRLNLSLCGLYHEFQNVVAIRQLNAIQQLNSLKMIQKLRMGGGFYVEITTEVIRTGK